jgi:transcription antitermination factor NusG
MNTEAPVAANPRHKWYIVHAYSNFEKKVADAIREQARTQGLEDRFSDILVPTEDVVEIRRKKSRLRPACACSDFDDGITILVGFWWQQSDLNGFFEQRNFLVETFYFVAREGRHFLVIRRSQFSVFDDFTTCLCELVPNIQKLAGRAVFTENLSGTPCIVEEIWSSDFTLQLLISTAFALDQRFKVHKERKTVNRR